MVGPPIDPSPLWGSTSQFGNSTEYNRSSAPPTWQYAENIPASSSQQPSAHFGSVENEFVRINSSIEALDINSPGAEHVNNEFHQDYQQYMPPQGVLSASGFSAGFQLVQPAPIHTGNGDILVADNSVFPHSVPVPSGQGVSPDNGYSSSGCVTPENQSSRGSSYTASVQPNNNVMGHNGPPPFKVEQESVPVKHEVVNKEESIDNGISSVHSPSTSEQQETKQIILDLDQPGPSGVRFHNGRYHMPTSEYQQIQNQQPRMQFYPSLYTSSVSQNQLSYATHNSFATPVPLNQIRVVDSTTSTPNANGNVGVQNAQTSQPMRLHPILMANNANDSTTSASRQVNGNIEVQTAHTVLPMRLHPILMTNNANDSTASTSRQVNGNITVQNAPTAQPMRWHQLLNANNAIDSTASVSMQANGDIADQNASTAQPIRLHQILNANNAIDSTASVSMQANGDIADQNASTSQQRRRPRARASPNGRAIERIARDNPYRNSRHRCHLCNNAYFARSCGLRQHMKWVHSGDRRVKCTKCGKNYTNDDELREHMKRHDNADKPFKCSFEQCSKQFCHKNDLRRHVYGHDDSAPFCCRVCGKKFTRFDHLLTHYVSHMKRNQITAEQFDELRSKKSG